MEDNIGGRDMRKLASIQLVNAVEPIEGADAIEKIRVLGWWVVVKKGEFVQGDKVVYCEIDSLLPERPEFEFLRPSCFKAAREDTVSGTAFPAGFRIKTIKLRGQVSQGICFPLSILPPASPLEEESDVTSLLSIAKWEPPTPAGMSGRVKGDFPGFIPKTDEVRVQVLEKVLERHRGKTFYITEKLDGSSFTAFLREGEFGICSRNLLLDATDDNNLMTKVSNAYGLEEKFRQARDELGLDLALQAELIGPGVQKNRYGLKHVSLRAFNVIDIAANRLLPLEQMQQVAQRLGVEMVPMLGTLTLSHSIDELVALSRDTSKLNPNIQREGIVLRPLVEEYERELGGRLSFKVINPQFLLKYDE